MWELYLEAVVHNDGCRLESLVELYENAHAQAPLQRASSPKGLRSCPGRSSFKSFIGDSETQPWLMTSCLSQAEMPGSWVGNLNHGEL